MDRMHVILSSAAVYTKNKFQMVPWWLWLLQIVCTSFFSMFFFVILADYVSNPEVTVRYVVIGNVIQSIAATTLYAIADLPGTEKHVGTLSPLMQTPASLFCVFLGMSILNIVAGLISSSLSLCYAQFIFGIDLTAANLLSVVVIVLLTVFSLTGFGMMIGSVGLRLRTSSIIANIISYIGLLICGVNFPLSYLPEWIQAVASALPLTYGVRAMRDAVEGAGIASISGDLMMMIGLGLLYFIISVFMFRMFEKLARNNGTYDMF